MLKKKWKKLPTLIILIACMVMNLAFTASAVDKTPIYSESDLTISSSSDAVAIPVDTVAQLSQLSGGTIIIDFTPGAMTIANTLISLSNSSYSDAHIHVYIDNRGFLGIEARNHGETRYVNLQAPAEVTSGTRHVMALSADPINGYKFYFDGRLVFQMPVALFELWEYDYRFMSAISGADVGYIGATYRAGSLAYPYNGKINHVQVYDTALDPTDLEELTYVEQDAGIVRQENVFSFEDWNTEGIRIPAIIRTAQGTIIAAGDIRYGDAAGSSNDPPNNCDIGIRVSSDNGETWSDPTMLMNFTDYPNEPQVPMKTDSASYCDSLLVNGANGRVFFFCDAMTGNVRAPYATASSGYTTDGYLILKDASGTQYELHEDTGKVYLNGAETDYTVGDDFTLYQGNTVAGNIFYTNYGSYDGNDVPKRTELRVIDTVFLVMRYSDDGGYTWSAPKLMNNGLKTSDMKHFGTAPGIGITIQTGKNAGRILAPIYYNSSTYSGLSGAVLYSDDNGETWQRGASPNDARASQGLSQISMGEIQIVEMPSEGNNVSTQLKMFVRQGGGVLIATSYDGGETWDADMPQESVLIAPTRYAGCQQSVINYSQTIDGYPAVIFANAASSSRANGTLRIGLIKENGTNSNGRTIFGFDWPYSKVIRTGEFGYSGLMEMPNGNVVCLYEQESRPDNIHSLVYGEYTLDYIKGNTGGTQPDPSEPIAPDLIYSAEAQAAPGTDSTYPTINADAMEKIAALHEGTIVVQFTPSQVSSVHSLVGFSNNASGYVNSHFHLYIASNKLGYEIRRQSGGDFEKSSVTVSLAANQTHTAAFVASESGGYKLFFDGELVQTILSSGYPTTGYGFLSDIAGINSGTLGMTDRNGGFQYPYYGMIDKIKIFSNALSDETLLGWTDAGNF